MKNIAIGTLTLIAGVVPMVSVISCGSNSEDASIKSTSKSVAEDVAKNANIVYDIKELLVSSNPVSEVEKFTHDLDIRTKLLVNFERFNSKVSISVIDKAGKSTLWNWDLSVYADLENENISSLDSDYRELYDARQKARVEFWNSLYIEFSDVASSMKLGLDKDITRENDILDKIKISLKNVQSIRDAQ